MDNSELDKCRKELEALKKSRIEDINKAKESLYMVSTTFKSYREKNQKYINALEQKLRNSHHQ